ncbi:phosphohistidine phosphatase SixA [soil metagenome]
MKTLYLLRHAKSSWDNPDLDDFDRPLNDRGEKDAPTIGKRLMERNVVAQVFYSSPAVRAVTTMQIIAKALGYDSKNIRTEDKLYHASEEVLLGFVKKMSDDFQSIMIAGHNPGLTGFANILQEKYIDNIPTTGVVQIDFHVDTWKDVEKGKLIFFDFPKK